MDCLLAALTTDRRSRTCIAVRRRSHTAGVEAYKYAKRKLISE